MPDARDALARRYMRSTPGPIRRRQMRFDYATLGRLVDYYASMIRELRETKALRHLLASSKSWAGGRRQRASDRLLLDARRSARATSAADCRRRAPMFRRRQLRSGLMRAQVAASGRGFGWLRASRPVARRSFRRLSIGRAAPT